MPLEPSGSRYLDECRRDPIRNYQSATPADLEAALRAHEAAGEAWSQEVEQRIDSLETLVAEAVEAFKRHATGVAHIPGL